MLRSFDAADRAGRALLLTGAAGIGKTALWEAGLALGRDAGRRVMAARASGAEAGMAFAGLIDLCEAVGSAELDELPRPQRAALEAALLRTEPPGGSPPDPHAIALAYLNVLRTMAVRQPLLVAVDDVPWLDEASTSVLVFAARRLREEPVAVLLTRRTESASSVELAVAPERLDVGPPRRGGAATTAGRQARCVPVSGAAAPHRGSQPGQCVVRARAGSRGTGGR
jgi:AAA ATPase domain